MQQIKQYVILNLNKSLYDLASFNSNEAVERFEKIYSRWRATFYSKTSKNRINIYLKSCEDKETEKGVKRAGKECITHRREL